MIIFLKKYFKTFKSRHLLSDLDDQIIGQSYDFFNILNYGIHASLIKKRKLIIQIYRNIDEYFFSEILYFIIKLNKPFLNFKKIFYIN